MTHLRLLTFVGYVKGLTAASLESQYFDEYVNLSKYVEGITIVTPEVSDIHNIPENVYFDKVNVLKISRLRGITKIISYVLTPLLNRKKFNLIYVRTMSPPEILSLIFAKIFLNTPSVLLIGGTCFYEPITFKNRIFRKIYSKALDVSDKIIVYSDKMIPAIKSLNPKVIDSKFEIIHNAVDEKRFLPLQKNISILEKLKIKNDKKIIMFVGTINSRKGVIEILKTLSIIDDKNVIALFIGNYNKESNDYKEIEKTIKSLNMSERVIFLGKIPNQDLPNYLSCANVFVYLTKSCEGIPRAILEAMSCGKPVISTSVAGIPDAVINDVTGYIVNDHVEAAKKVEMLLSDSVKYMEISRNCRKKVESEFVYGVTLPKLVKVFNYLINMS